MCAALRNLQTLFVLFFGYNAYQWAHKPSFLSDSVYSLGFVYVKSRINACIGTHDDIINNIGSTFLWINIYYCCIISYLYLRLLEIASAFYCQIQFGHNRKMWIESKEPVSSMACAILNCFFPWTNCCCKSIAYNLINLTLVYFYTYI